MAGVLSESEGYRQLSVSRYLLHRLPQRQKDHVRNATSNDVTRCSDGGRRHRFVWFGKLGSSMPVFVVGKGWEGWGGAEAKRARNDARDYVERLRFSSVDDIRHSCYGCLQRGRAWRPNTKYKNRSEKVLRHSDKTWQQQDAPDANDIDEVHITEDVADNNKMISLSASLSGGDSTGYNENDIIVPHNEALGNVVYDINAYWTASEEADESCDSAYDQDSLHDGQDGQFVGVGGRDFGLDMIKGYGRIREIEHHEGGVDQLLLEHYTIPQRSNVDSIDNIDNIDNIDPAASPVRSEDDGIALSPAPDVVNHVLVGGGTVVTVTPGAVSMGVHAVYTDGLMADHHPLTTDQPTSHLHGSKQLDVNFNTNTRKKEESQTKDGDAERDAGWDFDIDTLILEDEGGVSLTDTDDEDDMYKVHKGSYTGHITRDYTDSGGDGRNEDEEEGEDGGSRGERLSTSITAWSDVSEIHSHHHGNITTNTTGHYSNRPNRHGEELPQEDNGGDDDDTGVDGGGVGGGTWHTHGHHASNTQGDIDLPGARVQKNTDGHIPTLQRQRTVHSPPHEKKTSPGGGRRKKGSSPPPPPQWPTAPPPPPLDLREDTMVGGEGGSDSGPMPGQKGGVLRIKRKHLRRRFMDEDEVLRPLSGGTRTPQRKNSDEGSGQTVTDPFYLQPGAVYSSVAERVIERYRNRASSDSEAIMQKMMEHTGSFQKNFIEKVAERRRSMPQMPRKLEPLSFTSSLDDLTDTGENKGRERKSRRGPSKLALSDTTNQAPTSPLTDPIPSPLPPLSPHFSPKSGIQPEIPVWLRDDQHHHDQLSPHSLSPLHSPLRTHTPTTSTRRASYTHKKSGSTGDKAVSLQIEGLTPHPPHTGRRKSDVYPLNPPGDNLS